MDESEDNREFSKELVTDFKSGATRFLSEIKANLTIDNYRNLEKLAHDFKGQAATLGLVKVTQSAQRIQNYGKNQDEEGQSLAYDEYVERAQQ